MTCLRVADFPAISGLAKLEAPERYILEKNKYKILEDGNLLIEISGGSPTQSTGRICYINENVLKRFENDIITSNFCKAIELNNKKYGKKVQGLFDTIQKNQLENQELASLRDFLLPLLMNGQVGFKEGGSYE
mgnify:CR=1 FL=1